MLIKIIAPAKINLYLDILDKRSDGYHNVEMIMQTLNLFDKIEITLNSSKNIDISSNLSFPGTIQKNTAYIASQKFFLKANIKNPGINIDIEKNIPVCAGLAGGSSDAAAVLMGLNELFSANLKVEELLKICAEIGADVPFCFLGGTMLSTGTGTILSRLKDIPNCYIVLIKPNFSVSTKEAYDKADSFSGISENNIKNMIKAIENGSLNNICDNLYNKFEEVLKIYEITKIKNIMKSCNALNSCMSGSGPSVFGIFDNKQYAINCLEKLKSNYKEVFLVNPINHGCVIEK